MNNSNRLVAFGNVFGAPADVGSVDGAAGVGEIFHGLAHGDVVPGQPTGDGDAQGVEAGVWILILDAGAFQEAKPFVAPIEMGIGFGGSPGLEVFKQRDEIGVEGFGGFPAAFLIEANQAFFDAVGAGSDFDILHGVEVGLIQANAVPAGDEEAVAKLGSHGLGFALNGLLDLGELFVGQFGVEPARRFFQSEFVAGIGLDEAADYGFVHNDAQNLQFEDGGVAPGFILAVLVVGLLPPFGIAETVIARKLARQGYVLFFKKHFDGFPTAVVAGFVVGIVVVAGEKFGDPEIPGLSPGIGGDGTFGEGFFSFDLAGLAGVVADTDAKPGGFADDFIAGGITKLHPPKWRFFLFVKTGHSGMP